MGDGPAELSPGTLSETSRDAWLGGRLTLVQPKRSHRVGSDAALLAAAVDLTEGRLVDVGAGVGAVGLALAARREAVSVDLVEIDAVSAKLAVENAALNGLGRRVRVLNLDIGDARARRAAGLADETADAVVTNPPFFDPGTVRLSPNAGRARAHGFSRTEAAGAPLVGWVRACLTILKPGGRLVMIHRPGALASILQATLGGLGGIALLPVYPRARDSAHRMVVSGVKGSRAPLRIARPLVLHGADGRLTVEADDIHRGETLVQWE
jgi:tRNA1(Val) A37 N6-methylase TrmN6